MPDRDASHSSSSAPVTAKPIVDPRQMATEGHPGDAAPVTTDLFTASSQPPLFTDDTNVAHAPNPKRTSGASGGGAQPQRSDSMMIDSHDLSLESTTVKSAASAKEKVEILKSVVDLKHFGRPALSHLSGIESIQSNRNFNYICEGLGKDLDNSELNFEEIVESLLKLSRISLYINAKRISYRNLLKFAHNATQEEWENMYFRVYSYAYFASICKRINAHGCLAWPLFWVRVQTTEIVAVRDLEHMLGEALAELHRAAS